MSVCLPARWPPAVISRVWSTSWESRNSGVIEVLRGEADLCGLQARILPLLPMASGRYGVETDSLVL